MTSSFVKITFALIRSVLVCFSGSRKVRTQLHSAHTVNCDK